jgi:hypothetical protein
LKMILSTKIMFKSKEQSKKVTKIRKNKQKKLAHVANLMKATIQIVSTKKFFSSSTMTKKQNNTFVQASCKDGMALIINCKFILLSTNL